MKNEIVIPVYSDQEVYPKMRDIIKGIVKERFPDKNISFVSYRPNVNKEVLVFGKVIDSGFIPKNTKVVYTYSIAQMVTKANAATVLAAAVRQFIEEPERIPFVTPVWTASIHLVQKLNYDAPTVIDIETSGNIGKGGEHTPDEVQVLSVAIYQAGMDFPLVYVSRDTNRWEEYSNPLIFSQLEDLAAILPLFTKAIYHNGKFDTRVLNRVLGVKLKVWFDTMLAHHVLNQAAGAHGLKECAQRYLGAPDWEAGIKTYLKGGGYYERIPRSKLVEYNGWDVYWTYKLWEFLSPQIDADEEAQKAFMFEMMAAEFLLDVEQVGIPFDVEYASVLGSELLTKKDFNLKMLKDITQDKEFNPGSWQQVKRWLSSQGIETESTDEDHITEIMKRFKPGDIVEQFCVCLLNYRKAGKMYSTYVEGWRRVSRNGRVHPTFLVHGTSTGRLSSSNPNAQNVPRDKKIRRLVAITDGNKYMAS